MTQFTDRGNCRQHGAYVGICMECRAEMDQRSGMRTNGGLKSPSFGATMDPHVWTHDEIMSLLRDRDRLREVLAEKNFVLLAAQRAIGHAHTYVKHGGMQNAQALVDALKAYDDETKKGEG